MGSNNILETAAKALAFGVGVGIGAYAAAKAIDYIEDVLDDIDDIEIDGLELASEFGSNIGFDFDMS